MGQGRKDLNYVPNTSNVKIDVLILAAGQAQRFGRPKQLLPWGTGETILSHVIKQVSATPGISRIHVVLGAWFEEICTTLATPLEQVEIINNPDWQVGMFSSLSTGLRQLNKENHKSDGILVLLGDMPFITSETLSLFVDSLEPKSPRPLIAVENNRPAHPYLIRQSHIGEILSLSGESGIRPFIKKQFPNALKIPVSHTAGRKDIDTWKSYFANRPESSGAVIPTPP